MSNYYKSDALKPDSSTKELARKLGEDPAQKLQQIQALRSWILSLEHLQCRTDDQFLLRFLRVSQYSCETAKTFIQRFCTLRSSKLDGAPEWFQNQNPRNAILREMLSRGIFYMMPKPDTLGRLIVVAELENIGKAKTNAEDLARSFYIILDWIMHTYERAQINGIIILNVFRSNFDPSLMAYWTPDRMKKCVEIWQEAMPLRTHSIRYYKIPTMLKPLADLGLKFVSPEVKKRIQFHSDITRDEHIEEDCLPPSLGGTGPSWDELRDHMLRELDEFDYASLEMCKVDDAKVPKHYAGGDSWGIGGTYLQGNSY